MYLFRTDVSIEDIKRFTYYHYIIKYIRCISYVCVNKTHPSSTRGIFGIYLFAHVTFPYIFIKSIKTNAQEFYMLYTHICII